MVQGGKMTNYGPNEILDYLKSKSLSKLSENPEIVYIGSTILKLWLLIIMFNYIPQSQNSTSLV